jgi:hypothetical protein
VPSATLTAKQVVAVYFAAVAKGDWPTAHGCLDPAFDQLMSGAPDSDFNNLKSLSHVSIGDPYPAGRPGGSEAFVETAEMAVDFDAVYNETITVRSGPQTRFVLIGRHTAQSSWLIFGIGTGP